MDLILWRHAEAEPLLPGQEDAQRALTPKGQRHALRMAHWLDHHLPEGTRMLVSPAVRAEQTAQALQRKYKLRAELSPDSMGQDLLPLVGWSETGGLAGRGPVLLVGHQPSLGQLAALLLGLQAERLALRKGAVWWLRSRKAETIWQTQLIAAISPDLVAHA
jgi:phosphohistidine phosphatase